MNIKNQHVLSLIDAKKTTNNIYIFFEFCNGKDLRHFLDSKGGNLDEKTTKIITTQLVEGLCYLG